MSTWHVEGARLAAYARGDVDVAEAYQVEAHVVGCDGCQAAVATLVEPARLDPTGSDDRRRARRAPAGAGRATAGAARRRAARRAAARRHPVAHALVARRGG